MRFKSARKGEELKIKKRKVQFSFWPMGKGIKHEKLHSTLFVSDPWQVIEKQIRQMDSEEKKNINKKKEKVSKTNSNKLPNFSEVITELMQAIHAFEDIQKVKKQALHHLRQAKDFHKSMENSDTNAAKPLLLYYCFLNLAKCFIIYKERKSLPDKLYHGITEDLGDNKITVKKGLKNNAFKHFSRALLGEEVKYSKEISQKDFLSQILVGHRVYCQSQVVNFKEKFISLEEIHFRQDKHASTVWLLARAVRHDFNRIDQKIGDLEKSLNHSRLTWENVNKENTGYGSGYVFAQMGNPKKYKQKPSSVLNDLSLKASRRLWRIVTSHPPYRKYYIYIPDENEKLLHQLLSIYLATFYFGSITRYKPSEFDALLKGEMGAFIHEFFESQPNQFLYLMASEFMEQEVTKAAVV